MENIKMSLDDTPARKL